SAAPTSKGKSSLAPVSINARHTPGSAACAKTSPRRLRLRSTAKAPMAPLLVPRSTEPDSTQRKLGSNQVLHMTFHSLHESPRNRAVARKLTQGSSYAPNHASSPHLESESAWAASASRVNRPP